MNALDIKSLKKTYRNGTNALKGINLKVAKGDFFGLLRPQTVQESRQLSELLAHSSEKPPDRLKFLTRTLIKIFL